MENMKEKLLCDMTSRYHSNQKAAAWNGPEKLMSVKIVAKRVAKFYSGIHRYFAKQGEISLFHLIAESRILQSCFHQQPH